MKIMGKLIYHPVLDCLGYYKDGKFVKILTRREYEELETESHSIVEKIIKGGDKK